MWRGNLIENQLWVFRQSCNTPGNRKTHTTARAEKQRSRKPSPSLEQEDGTSQVRLWGEGVQMDTEQAQTNPHAYEEILPSLLTNTNTPTCMWFFQRFEGQGVSLTLIVQFEPCITTPHVSHVVSASHALQPST